MRITPGSPDPLQKLFGPVREAGIGHTVPHMDRRIDVRVVMSGTATMTV
jgi:hypothetical protein